MLRARALARCARGLAVSPAVVAEIVAEIRRVVLVTFAVGRLAEVARRTLCFSSVVVGVLAKCTARAVENIVYEINIY